jgi:hypothetical protein
MAGELRSPRSSADIDATSGAQRRIDPERIVRDLQRVGGDLDVHQDHEPDRTPGGTIVYLSFASRTDGGRAKIEVSVREDLGDWAFGRKHGRGDGPIPLAWLAC